jgi:hypothetical protein
MILRQYISGSNQVFPFSIRIDGVAQALGSYNINFKGQGNHTASVISYHLSAASASATVISVPYSAVVQSANVMRGTFDISAPDGSFSRSEPLHITVRT